MRPRIHIHAHFSAPAHLILLCEHFCAWAFTSLRTCLCSRIYVHAHRSAPANLHKSAYLPTCAFTRMRKFSATAYLHSSAHVCGRAFTRVCIYLRPQIYLKAYIYPPAHLHACAHVRVWPYTGLAHMSSLVYFHTDANLNICALTRMRTCKCLFIYTHALISKPATLYTRSILFTIMFTFLRLRLSKLAHMSALIITRMRTCLHPQIHALAQTYPVTH